MFIIQSRSEEGNCDPKPVNRNMIEMMKLIDKDFITATINMFKDLKEKLT